MGAPTPLLPPRIVSVPGVKSEGCRAKQRKKKWEKIERESGRAANLFLFFCLLNLLLLSHFNFDLRIALARLYYLATKTAMLRRLTT